jgi:outer membrane biosynthesis protein TonB
LITSVAVEAEVGADGCLGRIRPATEFPDRLLRYAVEEAVRSCEWEPGRDEQGKPVDMLVRVAVRFKPGY